MDKDFDLSLNFNISLTPIYIPYLMKISPSEQIRKLIKFYEKCDDFSTEWFTASQYIQLANYYIDVDEAYNAEQVFNDALKAYPNDLSILRNFLRFATVSLDAENLLQIAENALFLSADDAELHYLYALICNNYDYFDEAIIHIDKAIHYQYTNLAEAYITKTNIFEQQGFYTQSLQTSKKALHLFPFNHNLIKSLVNAGKYTGNEANVISFYQKIVDKHIYDRKAWHQLGIIYKLLNHKNQAIQSFQVSVALKPHPETYFELSACYEAIEDYSSAIEYLQLALKAGYDPFEIFIGLYNISYKTKAMGIARYYLKKALNFDPNQSEIWFELGKLSLAEQNYTEASKYFAKAKAIDPDNDHLWIQMARLHAASNDIDMAFVAYENAIDISADEPIVWIEFLIFIYHNYDVDQCLILANEAIFFNPESADLWYLLSCLNSKAGNEEFAEDALINALEINPECSEKLLEMLAQSGLSIHLIDEIEHLSKIQ